MSSDVILKISYLSKSLARFGRSRGAILHAAVSIDHYLVKKRA
jgi:hypothetical protein